MGEGQLRDQQGHKKEIERKDQRHIVESSREYLFKRAREQEIEIDSTSTRASLFAERERERERERDDDIRIHTFDIHINDKVNQYKIGKRGKI